MPLMVVAEKPGQAGADHRPASQPSLYPDPFLDQEREQFSILDRTLPE